MAQQENNNWIEGSGRSSILRIRVGDEEGQVGEKRTELLDLPAEILSQIASHLNLESQIYLLSLHPTLLSLARSTYSPIPLSIKRILDSNSPYPPLLARLPSLNLYIPDDGGRSFIDVLVRARPKWILENLEYGRWSDKIWKEAYERRFLRSWRRYKQSEDTWRAVFLRMLGRVEHRMVGCSHHENWTQFITLHRNGSASINRIYSRTFDPYEIYDEFKHQNNFASQPTHVRVILHLQDVRIVALGVLYSEPSIFVNPNAHMVLHPPLLRGIMPAREHDWDGPIRTKAAAKNLPTSSVAQRIPVAASTPSNNSNEVYFPLVRSLSPSGPAHTSYGIGESSAAPHTLHSPSSPGLLSTFARVLPGRSRRLSSVGSDTDDRGGLFRVKSRETREVEWEGKKRTWSFSRPRAYSSDAASSSSAQNEQQQIQQNVRPLTPMMPALQEIPHHDPTGRPPTPPRTPSPTVESYERRNDMPYSPLKVPAPHSSFRDYPNYTPAPNGSLEDEEGKPLRGDRRMRHEEVEDEGLNNMWNSADSLAWPDGRKMAEWDPVQQCYKRWVGPMLLMAQIHPSDKDSALPLGASGALEGDDPNMGHVGMYASLGYEDLEDLFPWVELVGTGIGGKSKRSGLGFE